jgi:hypothetical protein
MLTSVTEHTLFSNVKRVFKFIQIYFSLLTVLKDKDLSSNEIEKYKKIKQSLYRPGVAQRVPRS